VLVALAVVMMLTALQEVGLILVQLLRQVAVLG
jgi:hypothetical protein